MNNQENRPLKKQNGFTLVEVMVIMILLSIGTGVFAKGLLSKAKKRADVDALKALINLASRRSLIESKHFGVHFNPSANTIGLFEDKDKDNIFGGTDTLVSIVKCAFNSSLGLIDSKNVVATDLCFKKNGSVASDLSYQVNYVAPAGDSSKFQIIAASGRIIGP